MENKKHTAEGCSKEMHSKIGFNRSFLHCNSSDRLLIILGTKIFLDEDQKYFCVYGDKSDNNLQSPDR